MSRRDIDQMVDIARGLCWSFTQPLATHDDWHARVSLLTELGEHLALRSSEEPVFVSIPYVHSPREMTLSEARERLDGLRGAFEQKTASKMATRSLHGEVTLIDYSDVPSARTDVADVLRALGGVPSVEKLAISASALAISQYALPIPVITELCSIIRDEGLHLLALSRLLGQDPLDDGWITSKRQAAWNQIKRCSSPLEHVLLEHCLFEGEGVVAAADAVRQARLSGFPDEAIAVLARIAVEELRHATLGYYLAHILAGDEGSRRSAGLRALTLIREIEPLESEDTAKGVKQRFAARVHASWADTADWTVAGRELTSAWHAALLGLPSERLAA